MKLNELFERIYAKDQDLIVSIQSNPEASTETAISTFVRRNPYASHFKSTTVTTHSLFNYLPSKETTQLLSSIKGKGPLHVNSKMLDVFFDQVKKASTNFIKELEPDIIIFPKSNSTLNAEFVKILKKRSPRSEVISDAFIKKLFSAEDVEPLINITHPDWEKFSTNHPDEVKKLKQTLAKQLAEHGSLELKKLYKPYLKFITNFVELQNASISLEKIIDKKVLIVDDVLSTGTTMLEMIRQLERFQPKSLTGLTIFKRT